MAQKKVKIRNQLGLHARPSRFRPFLDFSARVAAVLAGAAIVVAGRSEFVGNFEELMALLGGAIGMLCLLKWRVSVPLALSVLLGLAAASGFIII